MNTTIIGGSDGPTSYFLATKTDINWINLIGLIIVVLMLLPNIVYAYKYRGNENLCKNKFMNIIEQIGRYLSMFLMIFNIGIAEFGYTSIDLFLIYVVGNTVLLLTYWFLWMLYFCRPSLWKSIALAVIPTMIFLISGITLRHYLLVGSAIIFGFGHIYVSYVNAKQESK